MAQSLEQSWLSLLRPAQQIVGVAATWGCPREERGLGEKKTKEPERQGGWASPRLNRSGWSLHRFWGKRKHRSVTERWLGTSFGGMQAWPVSHCSSRDGLFWFLKPSSWCRGAALHLWRLEWNGGPGALPHCSFPRFFLMFHLRGAPVRKNRVGFVQKVDCCLPKSFTFTQKRW